MRFYELYEAKIMEAVDYDSLLNPLLKVVSSSEYLRKVYSDAGHGDPFINIKTEYKKVLQNAKQKLGNVQGKQVWVMYIAKMYRANRAAGFLKIERNPEFKQMLQKLAIPDLVLSFPENIVWTINNILTDLQHYTSYNYEPIRKYDPKVKKWEDVKSELSDLEKEYMEKVGEDARMLKLEEDDKIIHDFGNGFVWVMLDRGACRKEGDSMGHCGNVPSQKFGDRILSFRKIRQRGKETLYEPFMTFIYNEKTKKLGEMKGRANEKPSEKYHPYIVWLLKQDFIKGFGPRGYAPEDDFQMTDLSPEQYNEVITANPYLALVYGALLRKLPENIRDTINMPFSTKEWDVSYDKENNRMLVIIPIDRVIDKHILGALQEPWGNFEHGTIDNDEIELFISYLEDSYLNDLYEKVKEIVESENMSFDTTIEQFVKNCKRRDFFGVFEEYLDEEDEPVDFEDNPDYEKLIDAIKSRIRYAYEQAYTRELQEKVFKNIPDIETGDITLEAIGSLYDKNQTDISEYIADDTFAIVYKSDYYIDDLTDDFYEDLNYNVKKLDFDRLRFDYGYVSYTKEEANDQIANYGFEE